MPAADDNEKAESADDNEKKEASFTSLPPSSLHRSFTHWQEESCSEMEPTEVATSPTSPADENRRRHLRHIHVQFDINHSCDAGDLRTEPSQTLLG